MRQTDDKSLQNSVSKAAPKWKRVTFRLTKRYEIVTNGPVRMEVSGDLCCKTVEMLFIVPTRELRLRSKEWIGQSGEKARLLAIRFFFIFSEFCR